MSEPTYDPTPADLDQVLAQLDSAQQTISGVRSFLATWDLAADAGPMPEDMVFGTSAPKGIDNLEGAIGVRFGVHRTYDGGFPTSFQAHDARTDVGKRMSCASVKWWSSDLAALERTTEQFATSWPADHYGFFIIDHEPEDNGTLDRYIDIQRVVSGVWRDMRPGVPFGSCFMTYDLDPNYTGPPIREYLERGAPFWDFVSWDGYDKGKGNTPKTAESLFGPARDLTAELTGLRFAVAEYGTVRNDQRAILTAEVADLVYEAGGVFATYWNSNGTGYDYPWKSADYPTVKQTALAYGGSNLPAGQVAEVSEQDSDSGHGDVGD